MIYYITFTAFDKHMQEVLVCLIINTNKVKRTLKLYNYIEDCQKQIVHNYLKWSLLNETVIRSELRKTDSISYDAGVYTINGFMFKIDDLFQFNY